MMIVITPSSLDARMYSCIYSSHLTNVRGIGYTIIKSPIKEAAIDTNHAKVGIVSQEIICIISNHRGVIK